MSEQGTKPPTARQARRGFVREHVDVDSASVLEIGAMDSPTFGSPDLDVEYLDWFSEHELAAMHAENEHRRTDRLVHVSHVVKRKRFSQEVPRRFDLVIANHVLEHIADPIAWLAECEQVTEPDGALFLSLPDRRYTFDYIRQESTFVDFLRAHRLDLEKPDFLQILAAIYFYRPVRAKELWEGTAAEKLKRQRFSSSEAIAHATARAREYADVHCHVFTRDSFIKLIDDLSDAELVRWQVDAIDDVQPGQNEFHVLLRPKSGNGRGPER